MNIEEIKNSHTKHHTSWTRGYISRVDGEYAVPYSGRFGNGYAVYTPSWESTRYHFVTYYVVSAR